MAEPKTKLMNCPECKYEENRVLDTRMHKSNDIRRRRKCLKCGTRFSTIESIITRLPHIKKAGGYYEPFDKEKLFRGIQFACMKRPVSLVEIEDMVSLLIREVQSEKFIHAKDLGHLVMIHLKNLDEVAYVRFASVYKNFKDIGEFVEVCQTVGLGDL